jgi:hypothetical protein
MTTPFARFIRILAIICCFNTILYAQDLESFRYISGENSKLDPLVKKNLSNSMDIPTTGTILTGIGITMGTCSKLRYQM